MGSGHPGKIFYIHIFFHETDAKDQAPFLIQAAS